MGWQTCSLQTKQKNIYCKCTSGNNQIMKKYNCLLKFLHQMKHKDIQKTPCYFSGWDFLLMLTNKNMCLNILLLFDCAQMLFRDVCY